MSIEPRLRRGDRADDKKDADRRDRQLCCGTPVHRAGQYVKVRRMRLSLSARVDRALRPVHRWIWSDSDRRVRKLLAFAKVEGDGGRDIIRAAEVTPDPLLRRLYLAHAIDELHHSDLFRQRGVALLRALPDRARPTQAASGDGLGLHLDDLR